MIVSVMQSDWTEPAHQTETEAEGGMMVKQGEEEEERHGGVR